MMTLDRLMYLDIVWSEACLILLSCKRRHNWWKINTVTALEEMLANSLSDCVSIACFFHDAFRLHTHCPSGFLLNSKAELSLATADVCFHHYKLFIPIRCGFKLILPYRHQPFLFHADCFPAVQACFPGNGHTEQSRQAGRHSPCSNFCHLKPQQPPAAPELRFQRNGGL